MSAMKDWDDEFGGLVRVTSYPGNGLTVRVRSEYKGFTYVYLSEAQKLDLIAFLEEN